MADESPHKVDCVVIGAGVIGLAVARELAIAGREVIVLEAAGAIGTETSSRNSEVIHAGLYYPAGSLILNPKDSVHSVWTDMGCVVLIQWDRPVVILEQEHPR